MKNIIYIFITFLIISLSNTTVFAQTNTDEELANQYFSNKEYDKAAVYFEKLLDKYPSQPYYLKLLDCFVELKEFKNAEKLIKRQQKQNSVELSYNVDLAYVYKVSGKESEAKQLSEKTIKQLKNEVK